MKFIIETSVLAIAILSQMARATPLVAARLPAVNTTLASWGIVQVPDLGLANLTDTELDKRAQVATFTACTDGGCNTCGTTEGINSGSAYCFKTSGRHYFRVTGANLYVSADPNLNCPARDSGSVPGGVAAAGCYLVNTGQNWQSSFVHTA